MMQSTIIASEQKRTHQHNGSSGLPTQITDTGNTQSSVKFDKNSCSSLGCKITDDKPS